MDTTTPAPSDVSTSDSITDAITSAIDDASTGPEPLEGEAPSPSTDAPSHVAPADAPAASSGPVSPSARPATPPPPPTLEPPPPPADTSDIDAMLAEAGIRPSPEGERPNRIPYPRVKKITEAVAKKLTTKYEGEIAPIRQKLTELETSLQNYHRQEQFAAQDPDGFVAALARADARYQKFLQPQPRAEQSGQPVAKPSAPPPSDPMPGPDNPDGYSQAGLERLLVWQARQVESKAEQKILERFKPILDDYRGRETTRQLAPKIAAERQELTRIYGDLLKTHEPELVAALKANPAIPTAQIIAAILVPKLRELGQADRTKMRTELLKEINAAPSAATRSAPSPAVASSNVSGPRTTEDIIRDAIAPFR